MLALQQEWRQEPQHIPLNHVQQITLCQSFLGHSPRRPSEIQPQQQSAPACFNAQIAGQPLEPRQQIVTRIAHPLQKTFVFDEKIDDNDPSKPLIDRLFPNILLSSFSASIIRDTRNDPVDPTNGAYSSASGQIAARAIGSQIGLVKSFLSSLIYRIVPGTSRVVLDFNT